MLNALFVSHDVHLAGAEIALLNFVIHLDPKRIRATVVVPRKGELVDFLEQHGISVIVMPYDFVMVLDQNDVKLSQQARAFESLFLALAPDVIVVNTSAALHALLAALTTSIPLVVHLHEYLDPPFFGQDYKPLRAMQQMWYQVPEKVVACSHWLAQFYQELSGREVIAVPNTVPIPEQTPVAPAAPPLAIMLATLEGNKRPDLFIEAAARTQRHNPDLDFQARIYGFGSRENLAWVQALIAAQNMGTRFTLHQRTKHTAAIYQQSTTAVVTSEVESFSMVVIEAASHHRPTIATRCGGPNDLIVDLETGFLIEPGDVQALSERLTFLLRNPAKARAMGDAAHAHYLAHFSPDVVSAQYQRALEDAVAFAPLNQQRRDIARPFARYFLSAP